MMDRIIEQLTTEAVRDQLDQVVKELVAERLSELLGDEDFTGRLDEISQRTFAAAIAPEPDPEPQFKSVFDFVDDFIRPMYATTQNDQESVAWSRTWYTHPEAVARLSGLWRVYEIQRAQNKQHFLEDFLRVHADYHMRFLMAENSVFSRCTTADTPSIPLPVSEPATTHTTGDNR